MVAAVPIVLSSGLGLRFIFLDIALREAEKDARPNDYIDDRLRNAQEQFALVEEESNDLSKRASDLATEVDKWTKLLEALEDE